MTYASDLARDLATELIEAEALKASNPTTLAVRLQATLDEARGQALREAASWHKRRQQLHQAVPAHASEVAKDERRARAAEAEQAATYFKRLPEAEAARDLQSEVGSDAATAAFRILYERPLRETNASFLDRATLIVEEVIGAAEAQATNAVPILEGGLPESWRLEKIELYGDKAERYRATLFRVGGAFVRGLGPTTRLAVENAAREAREGRYEGGASLAMEK